ncbi:hypothetical protein HED63_22720 [Ochrobactrum cytisi]|nr:hypothetical protein [Brucella cytisi]
MNKFNLATILAGCISMIAGCSTPDGNNWVKDGMPRSEAQQAYAECKYEAESSTATIGTGGRPPRTLGVMQSGKALATELLKEWNSPTLSRTA